MSTDAEQKDEPAASETVHIGWLPVGTRIRWADGAGRAHEGVLVADAISEYLTDSGVMLGSATWIVSATAP